MHDKTKCDVVASSVECILFDVINLSILIF